MSAVPVRFSSARIQRLAERAATGSLGPWGQRRLARQLATVESDRLAYDRLMMLFRTLEGGPLAEAQRERILEVALRASRGGPTERAGTWRLVRWLAPAALLLLLVPAALLLAPDRGELQSRGSLKSGLATTGRVGLQAFCVRGGKILAPPPRATGLDARCRLDDELQLVVTQTAGYGQLLVVGIQEGGERWYYPLPPTGRSGAAPRQVAEEPLGQAIHLAINHRPGPLRVLALFSRSATRADQIVAWLESADPDQPADELIQRLAGPGNEVTAVELRVMIQGGAP